ncbi:MAG: cation:proton antiporter [Aggregatilineales bacterium]
MEEVFTSAPHHDVLKLLIEIVVLLFVARFFGEIAQRMGQSSVVGEILAGIVLGPSLLSGLFPFIAEWIVPSNNVGGYLLEEISLLGIIFLLLITGLETDLALIRRQARSALGVALGGLTITLGFGFLLGLALPNDLLVEPDDEVVFAMFLAISMAISAIPVIAKVLMDLNLTRRDVGQTIIASAMIDDTVGWILLSVVIALAGGTAITFEGVAGSIGEVVLFLGFSFTVGQWIVARSLRFVQNEVQSRDKVLTLVVLLTFIWGIITHALHLEALLGAFVMGILFSRIPGLDTGVIHKLESIALGIFAPIFFATAGLKVNIVDLLEPRLLAITVLVTVVAMACKITGVYLGARYIGKRDHWSALFLGMGLNARGSMGIIVASIGLSEGVLNQDTFSIIVVMALVTSLIAPAALRWTLSHIQAEQAELDRLRKEEMNENNIIANTHRVLLPVRLRESDLLDDTQRVESRILERISAKTELEVTLFNIVPDSASQPKGLKFLDRIGEMFPQQKLTKRVVVSEHPVQKILEEVRKDYDLLVIGATQTPTSSAALFNPVTDELMRFATCPTMTIHGGHVAVDWRPRRILIPTNGSKASHRAAEVGFGIVPDDEGEVIILNAIETRYGKDYLSENSEWEQKQFEIAGQIVGELREFGRMLGIQAAGEIRKSMDVPDTILDVAREDNVDLIILGTSIRPGSDRLYLGPNVEHVLNDAPCPVVVVNFS